MQLAENSSNSSKVFRQVAAFQCRKAPSDKYHSRVILMVEVKGHFLHMHKNSLCIHSIQWNLTNPNSLGPEFVQRLVKFSDLI